MSQIDWVLHTHHHRDQCQGDHLLEARGVPIAVPEREAALFAETDAFWRLKRIYDNYDVSGIGFTLPRPVRISRTLRDYETFTWRGYEIRVLPTPGHTKGSVTFLAEVDGAGGRLLRGPGRRARPRPHDPRPPVAIRAARRRRRRAPLGHPPRRPAAPAPLPVARPPDRRRRHGDPTPRAQAPGALRPPGRDAEEPRVADLASRRGPAEGPRPPPPLGESRTRCRTATR